MEKVRLLLVSGLLVVALAAAGCSRSGVACAPVENGVGVCLQGKPITWSPELMKPHMHESGGYYGPVVDLAAALGATPDIAPDKKSVTVGGKSVVAQAINAKGIHEHNEAVYVPIREFALAAGYHVMVDSGNHTVDIRR